MVTQWNLNPHLFGNRSNNIFTKKIRFPKDGNTLKKNKKRMFII